MFAIPSPADVIDNLDAIKEWLILIGLVLGVAALAVTLGTQLWKFLRKRRHAKEASDGRE